MMEMLKQLIKEAVLEALIAFTNQGVSVANTGGVEDSPSDGPTNDSGDNTGNNNNNNNNNNNGGNTGNDPIRPDPMYGFGGFSLRKP